MIKFIKDLIDMRRSYTEHQIELYRKAKRIIINGDIDMSPQKKIATYKEDRIAVWCGIFEPKTTCYINDEEFCDMEAIKKLMRLMSDIAIYKDKDNK